VPNKAQDDDLVMSLVELALARPPEERERYLHSACAHDSQLFEEVRKYVGWEERMNGFLLEPLYASPSRNLSFEPGELLDGRFRIVREVAQGGMGIVYEAVDERLERRIAIKCAKPGFRKRLPPEVRHATEISHPNVCKIFEIHTGSTDHGEIDFLTMEFLEGETLADRLRRGPLPESQARAVAQQLCAGLAEAHHKQVIHGDLKSNNVILTTAADGSIRAVITDFGLARRPETTQQTVQSGALGGTPDYMAPELWRGEKASVASDIFALGVILHELASGRRPYGPQATWEERLSRKPPAANPKWDRVLARCLDPDPQRRFRSADEVAQALAPRSWRWVLAAAAAVVLAVVSGVVTYEQSVAPKEAVRLAVLPFEADAQTASMAETAFRTTAGELSNLKGGSRVKLSVASAADTLRNRVDTAERARSLLGATNVLRVAFARQKDQIVIHAYLIDARSGGNKRDWNLDYAPKDLRFAPVALAGMVTATLRLPPLALAATVNSTARQDYQEGLAALRWYSGVDAALYLLGRAAAEDSDSPLTHAALAEAEWLKYALTKNSTWLDRTVESVRLAEYRNPDLAPVHAIAGLLKANAGAYEQAVMEYQRAVELDPLNGDAYRRLGSAYQSNNQLNDALLAFQKATQVQPDYFKPFQSLGSFYRYRGNYAEAIRAFQKMVALAPDLADAHFALAAAYRDLGRFADAEKELRVSTGLQDTPQAEHDLGYTLMFEGKDQDAIRCYLRALALGLGTDYLTWLNLGISYDRVGSKNDSQASFRRAIGFAEEELLRDSRNGRVRAYFAYLLARLGESQQRAASEAEQAVQFSPNDKDTRMTASETYEILGLRESTISLLSHTPESMLPNLLAELNRHPAVADLRRDSRFLQLMAFYHVQ
jgi:tetratricopeptide (TPR) repeat protein